MNSLPIKYSFHGLIYWKFLNHDLKDTITYCIFVSMKERNKKFHQSSLLSYLCIFIFMHNCEKMKLCRSKGSKGTEWRNLFQ